MDNWAEQAICRQVDPDLWYDEWSTETALALCNLCPARKTCLQVALAEEEKLGTAHIWGNRGGWTAKQRTRWVINKRRRERRAREREGLVRSV